MVKKSPHIKNILLLLTLALIITIVFILSWSYAYKTTRVGYISKHLSKLPLHNISENTSIIEIELRTPTPTKILLDDFSNINKVISFLYEIEGYKTTDFSHEGTFWIDFSSPKETTTIMFSKNYICIVKNNNYKSYKINLSYYTEFVELLSTLSE